MILKMFCIIILYSSSVIARHVPRYNELDDDDQLLFRAAYDTPYGHEEYTEEEDLPVGKLDLLKDGLWAIKAKIKEIKAFNKALAANLLSTKLQVKEMLVDHLKTLKQHHHVEIDKKPAYNYQIPPSQPPAYPQYEPAHYTPPAPPQYGPPQYGPPQYGAPQYGAPQYSHDPYYGH